MKPSPVREQNLLVLERAGFRVADNLPVRRDLTVLRPQDEVLGRLLALKALWLWVDVHPNREDDAVVLEMLDQDALRQHLTAEEREILELSREEADASWGHLMGWRNENCWSLAWVLGFSERPEPQVGQLGGDLGRRLMLQWLPNSARESTELRARCEVRRVDEVVALEDLFYCAHNAVRNAQFNQRDSVPSGFSPISDGGCVHERRHALTWVLSPGVAWESTDLST